MSDPAMSDLVLFHYCCVHSWEAICRERVLKPGADGLVWLTDLKTPNRHALGLTSEIQSCDRTKHRVRVGEPPVSVVSWMDVRRELPGPYVLGLEGAPGARPRHWWVGVEPIPVDVEATS